MSINGLWFIGYPKQSRGRMTQFLLVLSLLLGEQAWAGPCTVPLLTQTKTYDCPIPGAMVTVAVRETDDQDGFWAKEGNLAFQVVDSRNKKVLDSGKESVTRGCRDKWGEPELRQYSFGDHGRGSLMAYFLSDDDQGYRRIWVNSTKVPARGYFETCRLRRN